METGSDENTYLLDTSAFLTFMEEEGTDVVDKIMRTGQIIIPFVVLLELYYITLR
jgi:predicted nucleic acid-binding protein